MVRVTVKQTEWFEIDIDDAEDLTTEETHDRIYEGMDAWVSTGYLELDIRIEDDDEEAEPVLSR